MTNQLSQNKHPQLIFFFQDNNEKDVRTFCAILLSGSNPEDKV